MASRIALGKSDAGKEVYIDIPTLISTRLLVTASSGGGKSETLRRILEEAVSHVQCIVIDPEGEFSTLREKKPFVLIGEGGEATADIRTAAMAATRLLELNASAICDIYEMRANERHIWVQRFLDALVHAPKALWHPVLVIVDEAHTYCPEHGYSESVAAQSIIDLCNLGRKRGFCAILATQRLSKLSKNAVEPLQNYLVGRTMYDDQKRAAGIFKIDGGAATREFSLELERLESGQFVARGRAFNGDMLKVQVTRGETRAPKTGTAMAGVVTPAPEAIKALLPKLADLPQEAEKKAKTEDDLRRELRDANTKVATLTRQLAAQQQESNSEEVKMLRESIIALQREADEADRQMADVMGRLNKAAELSVKLFELLSGSEAPRIERTKITFAKPVASSAIPVTVNRALPKPTGSSNSSNLPKAERAILTVLAQLGSCTPEKIAAYAGYSVNGGGFQNSLSSLRSKGFVKPGSPVEITEDGVAALGSWEELPAGPELLRYWVARSSKAEGQILSVLADNNSPLSIEELADRAGYAPDGGGFNNSISRLRTLGLVSPGRPIRLTDEFAEAIR